VIKVPSSILLILLLTLKFGGFSQNSKLDSLRSLLKQKNHDTSVIKIYSFIGEQIYETQPDSAIMMWEKVISISEKKLKSKLPETEKYAYLKEISNSCNNIGFIAQTRGKPNLALFYLKKSLKISEIQKDYSNIAITSNNIGYNLQHLGNTSEALEYYNRCLLMNTRYGTKKQIMNSLIVMGDQYNQMNDFTNAISYLQKALLLANETADSGNQQYIYILQGNVYRRANNISESNKSYFKSLEINKKMNNLFGISMCCNNLGVNYFALGEYEKALNNFKQSLTIKTEQNHLIETHPTLINIAQTYIKLSKPDSGEKYFNESLRLAERIGNKQLAFASLTNMSLNYFSENDFKPAQSYGIKALQLSEDIGFPENIKTAASILNRIYLKKGDYKEAYKMFGVYIKMRDSLDNLETQKAGINSRLRYEYDLKSVADSVKIVEERKLSSAKLKQEKTQRYALYGGIFLIALFAVFMFNRYKKTNKQKLIIEEKEKEAREQKKIVEEKNKEILDSINYAKRLQDAILPSENNWKQNLPDSFILYKPKDIVAGDFYWMESFAKATDSEGFFAKATDSEGFFARAKDSEGVAGDISPSVGGGKGEVVLIAAADCTGHGVPGALVSVVCSNALNRVVKEFGIYKPNEILDKVKTLVIETFEKSEKDVKDGMDISMCSLNIHKNGSATLHWAGANNPIWIVQNGVMTEIKGDKQPIGKHFESKPFTQHTIKLNKNDSFYIFTDGFADQFGGPKGKKFKYKPLQKLLLESSSLSAESQKQLLNTEFENWKKELEQVDDICIIGVRI